jgi:pimeloyl-ACP methyl ester carboxylesterase
MLAAARGRRIDALALIATSAQPESVQAAALREKTIAATRRDFPRTVDALVAHGTHASFREDAGAVQVLREMMLSTGAETAVRQHQAVMARADHRATARALRLPCTVLVGDDDRITPPPLAEELSALIPGARLERLPACGHLAPLEHPHRVAAALRSLANEET